jgi:predicted HicB family RNase H-like nuclease
MSSRKATAKAAGRKPRSADYLKIVEWSDEGGFHVGSAPPIIGGACHGEDQVKVYGQICGIVDEWLEIMERDGIPVPAATAGKEYSGTFNLRADQDLHKAFEIRATQVGESLNSYCVKQLSRAVTHKSLSASAKGSS